MLLSVLSRNWWALAIRGILALLFGIMAFGWPGITLGVLVLLFGAYVIWDGIFAIASAITHKGKETRWWALLIEGILGIAAGILTFTWPGLTALVLLYIIAFWAIVTGIFEIIAAFELRKEIKNEWLLVLGGIASIVFGVLLLFYPGAGALAVAWWIGAYAIFFGVMMLGLAFRLRSWERDVLHHAHPRAA